MNKENKDISFTTTNAGLYLYDNLWVKYDLNKTFDSVIPKQSGKPYSNIAHNLLNRNLIDANSMTALAEKDKEEQKKGSGKAWYEWKKADSLTDKLGTIINPKLVTPLIYALIIVFVLLILSVGSALIITKYGKQHKTHEKIRRDIRRGERALEKGNTIAGIETYKKLKRQFNLLKTKEKRKVYKDILKYYSKVAKKAGSQQIPSFRSKSYSKFSLGKK